MPIAVPAHARPTCQSHRLTLSPRGSSSPGPCPLWERQHRDRRQLSLALWLLTLAVALLLVMTACVPGSMPGSSAQPGSQIKYGGALTIVPGPYGRFQRFFNPFAADNSTLSGTKGMIYETLLFFNQETGQVKPWLATGFSWSSDLKTLTFQLRRGVEWSDGQPFTSDDVVFTLNLLHRFPALDLHSIWTTVKEVAAPDPSRVVVTFKQPSFPEEWYIGGQTYIVPRHIWEHFKDPVHEANPNPIGTGPFVLKSFDPTLYILERNPHYWQPGKPYISQLRYPAYVSNASADLLLAQGSIDWTGLFSSNLQSFVGRDPAHNRYWLPPIAIVMLYLNTARYPFNLLPVRQAISLAINRERLSKEGENGYEPPPHPTGIVLPAYRSFLAPQYRSLSFQVDRARAIRLLEGAGFVRGSDGIFVDREGRQLAFSMEVVSGWTDWEKDCKLMAQDLAAIGISVTVKPLSLNTYISDLQLGSFESAISWTNSGPSPYYLYDALLDSTNTAPIGKSAPSNWERWSDPTTDQLLAQYAHSTDPAVQQQALNGLQRIMVEQLPSIPLLYSVNWYEYTTARFVGWPDEHNPYAVPSPYSYPDNEQVALALHHV
ncbi:ABC transporter substrate-binding protein [Thermogemmatispora carboxidivorans]|uniref:ABC transporter substrate-binding protein n=1 Tax=Thermogemmatispora carboxidivorans TaxID=1382306 RepID=UPI00069B03BB|nr:ABC transporter substrate-binding protein [Thermogemmatispora carboxidivorans]